jgi:hypothetical protein
MNYRKLRIAWSVGCGVLCLLLIALWVRSYFATDEILTAQQGQPLRFTSIASLKGSFVLRTDIDPSSSRYTPPTLVISYAPCVVVAIAAALLPWLISRRFSLRALLIGMTVAAALLGAAIVALRGS